MSSLSKPCWRAGRSRHSASPPPPLKSSYHPPWSASAGPASSRCGQREPKRVFIGVGKGFDPPRPPNRTCGFLAYGSPVGGFLIGGVSHHARPLLLRAVLLLRRMH